MMSQYVLEGSPMGSPVFVLVKKRNHSSLDLILFFVCNRFV